jgi:hypothetical protein
MTAPKKKPGKKPAPARKPAAEMGRPSKYDPEFHPYAAWMLAIRGKTAKEIAAGLRISTATLDTWQNIHPDFLSSLQAGRGVADAKVEQALFKRATGYDYEETKTIKDDDSTRTETTKKQVVPDVAAIKLWLTNRRPEDWKDLNKTEHSGPGGTPIPVSAVDVEKILGTDGYRDYEKKVFDALSAKPPNAGV